MNSSFSSNQKILAERYILQEELGSGLTSKVFKVLDVQTGETKAAKIFENNMSKAFEKEKRVIKLINELDIPTNIKCYQIDVGYLTHNGESEQKMYEILEYASHGSLFDKIESTKEGFSEDVCKYLLFQIINVFDAIHKKGICHRDFKPENILIVGDNYELKLCDYGSLTKFTNEKNEKKKLIKSFGTKYYCAPEILESKKYDGEKVDIFSIGATLFILLTRKFAFEEAVVHNLSMKISKILYKLIKTKQHDKYWYLIEKYCKIQKLSPEFKNLFVKMVAYNPDERPTIDEIRKSEFLKDITNASEEYLNLLQNKMIEEMNAQKI